MASNDYKAICEACGACNGTRCAALMDQANRHESIQPPLPQTYSGIRFSSDAFDCAIPVAMDSHSGCSYNCLYCFSNNLMRDPTRNEAKNKRLKAGSTLYAEMPIKRLAKFLDGCGPNKGMERAAYQMISQGAPMQWGALGDPFDEIERATGWGLQAIKLFQQHRTPVRVSTKGADLLLTEPYQKALDAGERRFWFAFSTITANDEAIARIDLAAPNASRRMEAMRWLTSHGFKCSLRFRPFIPGVSDAWPGEPQGWKVLLEKAAAAGASAVSFEWVFLSQNLTPRQKAMYQLWFREIGRPDFSEWYTAMSDTKQACRRANRSFKFDLTMAIREHTHKLGMVWSCSDPHFKEFGDTGCCCGILPDDPVFGGWNRKQLCQIAVDGRLAAERGERRLFTWADCDAEWAKAVRMGDMVCIAGKWDKLKDVTFSDHLRNKWNNPKHPRGPFRYLGGILRPCGVDANQDVIYRYESWRPGNENPRPIMAKDILTAV